MAGTSVSTTGPRGSQTQVRLHGAEANHTLLIVDGIRFNDPAAANEARFELLASDRLDRIKLVTGPQSATWGAEAIGGVILADTANPLDGFESYRAFAEHGSLASTRAAGHFNTRSGKVGVAGSGAWMRSGGIDSFGTTGERDGFAHRSASAKLVYGPVEAFELGAVGHWVEGESEYDGFDPATFRRADTLDETRNRLAAIRGWGKAQRSGWTLTLDGSLLVSANRNFVGDAPLNRTLGRRFTASTELSKTIRGQTLTGRAEHQSEGFRARGHAAFGAADQDRSRELTAFVGQWEGRWHRTLTTELSVRRDSFSAFADATTMRASATFRPVRRLELFGGYGEGIAQPTFYDLYGFFPGSFTGNPALRPERSTGWFAGTRFGDGTPLSLYAAFFRSNLTEEIVDVTDPVTFRSTTANATGTSRRQGIDVDLRYRFGDAALLMLTYSWLDAEEQQAAAGALVREIRRPRHRAGFGGHGALGPVEWGATLAYVGTRRDTNFDVFPFQPVRLGAYWLGSIQLGWRFAKGLEAFVRAENALDEEYQDVLGYRTEGRTVHAGLRFRLDP
jgi:vitamin B12 transporter